MVKVRSEEYLHYSTKLGEEGACKAALTEEAECASLNRVLDLVAAPSASHRQRRRKDILMGPSIFSATNRRGGGGGDETSLGQDNLHPSPNSKPNEARRGGQQPFPFAAPVAALATDESGFPTVLALFSTGVWSFPEIAQRRPSYGRSVDAASGHNYRRRR